MEYIYKSTGRQEGYKQVIGPDNSGIRLIEFGLLTFSAKGKEFKGNTAKRELGMNILGGKCDIKLFCDRYGEITYSGVGKRATPFDGPPYMVYIPVDTEFAITSVSDNFEAALYFSPTTFEGKPVVVSSEEIQCQKTGCLNWTREVRSGLGPEIEAGRLILGETLNPSGNWSSYPPHKHDEFRPPNEAPYEEIYYFLFKPENGFALIRLYTDEDSPEPFDKAYATQNGDAIAIPRGYHPMTVAPGYKMCYLFALAGEQGRMYGAWSDDPNHHWVKDCETILKGD